MSTNSRLKRCSPKRRALSRHGGRADRERLERADGRAQGLRALLAKEHACRLFRALPPKGFQGPALAIGNHGRAAGLSLQRGDAKVFLGGKDEGPGALKMIRQHPRGLIAHERHVRPGQRPDLPHVRAVADDDQALVGHLSKGIDDQVNAFVGNHAGGRQIEILLVLTRRERLDIDRRVDHGAVAPIGLGDPPPDEVRDGHEMIHAMGGSDIPQAQAMKQVTHQPSAGAPASPRFPQVLVLQIPRIAHGRVDVAKMRLIRPRQHALGHRMAAGDHQVIPGQIELLDPKRHERQVGAIMTPGPRHALQG